jgi:hypothetical protein
VKLYRGERLYFGAVPAIVAADTIVSTTGTTVIPIEPATATIASGDTASVFPYAEAVNVSSASLANNIEVTDTGKTRQGRRRDGQVVVIAPETSGDLYFNLSDDALWTKDLIFDAMQKGQEVFIYQELAAGQFAILGRALVSSFDSTQDAQAIVTVSYTFRFQSDFVYFTPASYNTPAAVTQYNNVRRLFGQVEVA